MVMRGREYFLKELARLGCTVWPSQSNFVMFRPPMDARRVFETLLERGIIVRHLGSFGVGDCIRVNVGTDAENARFIETLEGVLQRHEALDDARRVVREDQVGHLAAHQSYNFV